MSRTGTVADPLVQGPGVGLSKLITAIADNTATVVYTVNVPNATGSFYLDLDFLASLGAGGAVGAFETNLTAHGRVLFSRVAGASVVVTNIALSDTGSASVAGGDTATFAYSNTITVNTVGAANTVQVKVTIHDTGGSATNHQCFAQASVTGVNGLTATLS